MNIIELKKATPIKELRKLMRSLNKDGSTLSDLIIVEGIGQIQKICNRYAFGPVPEKDDSDPMSDYSAWTYGLTETVVLNFVKSCQ